MYSKQDSQGSLRSGRWNIKLPHIDHEEFFKTGIESEEDLNDLKFLLTTPVASTFNTNVLRIALNMQEEKIASVLVGLYSAKIDEEMLLRAIRTN